MKKLKRQAHQTLKIQSWLLSGLDKEGGSLRIAGSNNCFVRWDLLTAILSCENKIQ